ncbi:hypothetical protein MT378_00330 [Psychrobacter sp. 16-Bac2893]|tara:strand:+ start:1522 stop:2460 length:939 start_codon:yes stop_codon:yes gene_type:complete
MKFYFAGMNVTLNRKELSVKRIKGSISQQDLDAVNQNIIEKILENGEVFYQNKLADITLDLSDKNLQSEAMDRIEKDGIFIIPSYLDESIVDELCKIIEKQSESYLLKLGSDEIYEDNLVIVQKGLLIKKNYSELANATKSVFNIRTGKDNGMVDIFNIDKVIKDKSGVKILTNLKKDGFLNELLNSLPKKLAIRNINSYVNTGVTETRGFHVDCYAPQLKIFIYLTDVLLFDNGPYTFVKGTHLDTPYRHINQHLSKDLKATTEAAVVPFEGIYPILAPKGSLVVSDQSGFHRGFPQSLKGTRRVLTISCN